MTRFAPLLLVFALTGCAGIDQVFLKVGADPQQAMETVASVEEATLGNAMRVVSTYCAAPFLARSVLRDRMNGRPEAEGAKIGVFCPGDPDLVLAP